MKYLLSTLLVLLFAFTTPALAQSKKPCMPPDGYWVIESNVKTPKQSVVYCYNNDNILVYKEQITGRKLNVNRPKIVRQLNAALNQALVAWKNNQPLPASDLLARNR
jgi:hypothetical protein